MKSIQREYIYTKSYKTAYSEKAILLIPELGQLSSIEPEIKRLCTQYMQGSGERSLCHGDSHVDNVMVNRHSGKIDVRIKTGFSSNLLKL